MPSVDPLVLLERVRNDPRFAFDPSKAPDLIDDALIAAGGLGGGGEVIDSLDPSASGCATRACGGRGYGATRDFTALHPATASQAAPCCCPMSMSRRFCCRGSGNARRRLYRHRPSCRTRPGTRSKRGAPGTPAWPDLLRSARGQDDEHSMKLCYSALWLRRITGDRMFRWLAARKVGALKDVGLPAWRNG